MDYSTCTNEMLKFNYVCFNAFDPNDWSLTIRPRVLTNVSILLEDTIFIDNVHRIKNIAFST